MKPTPGGSSLWIGTDNGGLARWEDGRITTVPGLPPGASANSLVEQPAPGGGTELYVGTYGHGVARRVGGGWRFFTTRDGLPSDFVTDLCALKDPTGIDTLWATTLNGLARYRQGIWTAFTRRKGLPTATLYRILPTRSPEGRGRLWIGSGGAGLLRLDLGGWKTLDLWEGLAEDNVWSVAETLGPDRQPTLWVGTSKGLLRWHGGRWAHVAGQERVMSLTVDGEGGVWAGTLAGIDHVAPGGRVTHLDERNGLPHNRISCGLASRGSGGGTVLWFGTEGGGLARSEQGRWRTVDTRDGLPSATVNCLLETEDRTFGRVFWVGTRGEGLAGRRPDGSWIRFTLVDGLPNGNVTSLQEVRTPAGGRELWAGTFGKGAARLPLDQPTPHWEAVTLADRPAHDIIQSILQDPAGNVYLFTLHGVLRIDRLHLADPPPFPTLPFGAEDGLPSEQINPRAGFVDRRGWLWAGTTSGLAVLNPGSVIRDVTPKPLLLHAALEGTRKVADLPRGTALAYWQRGLAFRFTLVDFFRTGEHQYRSQLEGLEDQPTTWGPGTFREFSHLPPGSFVFKVWARDAAGNVSGPEAFPFTVRPAPWKTPWFTALALLALGGGRPGGGPVAGAPPPPSERDPQRPRAGPHPGSPAGQPGSPQGGGGARSRPAREVRFRGRCQP
jgi:ligand-binding sensor domain-containing protein